ncbi:MAG: thioredoxin family protein [Methanotrichaceae archaeon]|nr:thioredoxin family protein [Methanotrichaceae archaeon]
MEDTEGAGQLVENPATTPREDFCDPSQFTKAVSEFDKLYVSFVSEHCNACAKFKEEVNSVEVPHPVLEISADRCPRLADHFQVRVVPTVMLLQNGNVISTYEGTSAIEKMKQGM